MFVHTGFLMSPSASFSDAWVRVNLIYQSIKCVPSLFSNSFPGRVGVDRGLETSPTPRFVDPRNMIDQLILISEVRVMLILIYQI